MAATATGRYSPLDRGAHTLLRARRTAAETLPAPDEEWHRVDVPDVLAETLRSFRDKGIVEVVRTERYGSTPVQVYRTTQAAYDYVQALDEPGTPCGHTGVRNVRDEAGYTCCEPSCDARFDRETAREVMDG